MTNCPTCLSQNNHKPSNLLTFESQLRLPVYHCRFCDHRWLHTTPEEQARIEAVYDRAYTGFRYDPYFVDRIRNELSHRLRHMTSPKSRILDVGCGNGTFLSAAQEAGYKCEGIDISESSATICKEQGLSTVTADYTQYHFNQKFDAITMWDVLEHLRNPMDFLQKSYENLEDIGALIIKVPMFGVLNFSLLKLVPHRSGLLLGAPGHVQYYSKNSLLTCLTKAGFKKLYVLPNIQFRSKPPTRSIKKKVARKIQKFVYTITSNRNAYYVVYKSNSIRTIDKSLYTEELSL